MKYVISCIARKCRKCLGRDGFERKREEEEGRREAFGMLYRLQKTYFQECIPWQTVDLKELSVNFLPQVL